MNDMLGNSECSSGCESGWTVYLEQSFLSQFPSNGYFCGEEKRGKNEEEEEEEEEDLSMVSDASSGPPHFHEEDDGDSGCFFNPPIIKSDKKQKHTKISKKIVQDHHQQKHPSLLDDTASSHNNFNQHQAPPMENVVGFSQGYSANHYERRSGLNNGHFGVYQSGNQIQQNQWFGGKRRG